jgi:hypothetical protein
MARAPVKLAGGSGNLNTLVAGTITGGTAITRQLFRAGSLSAEFALTAATATIQLFAVWQVSHDNVTWITMVQDQANVAPVAITTGTAAIVTVSVPAPRGCEGYEYVRAAVKNTVATGAAGDLYAFTYDFEARQSFENQY